MDENGALISKYSSFKGNISAKQITVEGEVIGDIKASSAVFIKGNGRVEGDIQAPKILVQKGGLHKGAVYLDSSDPKFTLHKDKPTDSEHKSSEKPPSQSESVARTPPAKKKSKLW